MPAPEALHPALWRADQLGSGVLAGLPSGFAALDAQLPGAGWPQRCLTELLLPHPGVGEMRLLGPCLAGLLRQGRPVMLFDPPAGLSGAALAALGIDAAQLLVVYTRRGALPADGQTATPTYRARAAAAVICESPAADAPLRGADSHVEPGGDPLWALEQALRSGHVGAVLAWLPPRLAPERLRRLQLAAQAHDGPAFMLREAAAREWPSAAPLRLALRGAGIDRLAVRVLKRRGPLLSWPLVLALPPVLPPCVIAQVTAFDLLQGVASRRSVFSGTEQPPARAAQRAPEAETVARPAPPPQASPPPASTPLPVLPKSPRPPTVPPQAVPA